MKLSILMPAYNEIKWIAAAVDLVRTAPLDVKKELVIVDDGSTDGTREWLQSTFGAETDVATGSSSAVLDKRIGETLDVRVAFHDGNRGKGAALKTAMQHASGDIIVVQDADLEYDPADWKVMYDLIAVRRVADVVYGSRFYGKPHRSMFYHHYIANRLISILFNALFNQTLSDIEVCYKMFTREVMDTMRLTCEDFGVEIQISAQIARAGRWRIYEVGIHYFGRSYDQGKKIRWTDGLKALYYIVKFRIRSGR